MKQILQNLRNGETTVVEVPSPTVKPGHLRIIGQIINRHGIIGVAAGSLFVFKGKYKAVLINYPNPLEKESLIDNYFLKNETNLTII